MEYSKEEIIEAQSRKINISDVLDLNFNLLKDKNIKTKFNKTKLIENDGRHEYINNKNIICFSDFGFTGVSRLESQRLTLFKEKGTICSCCGLVATHFRKNIGLSKFAIEKLTKPHVGTFHLNLYGLKDNSEVLFTKDHIVAKSNGGKNIFNNYATMCSNCNRIKGSYNISLDTFKKLYEKYNISELKEILNKYYN